MCVCVCERESVCVCMYVWECVCERASVCMCVWERESVCVCVCGGYNNLVGSGSTWTSAKTGTTRVKPRVCVHWPIRVTWGQGKLYRLVAKEACCWCTAGVQCIHPRLSKDSPPWVFALTVEPTPRSARRRTRFSPRGCAEIASSRPPFIISLVSRWVVSEEMFTLNTGGIRWHWTSLTR